MGKTHDESKDLRSLARIGNISYANATITIPKGTVIGIKMWGKIDYLVNHKHWIFRWGTGSVKKTAIEYSYKETKKEYHKLKTKKHDSE